MGVDDFIDSDWDIDGLTHHFTGLSKNSWFDVPFSFYRKTESGLIIEVTEGKKPLTEREWEEMKNNHIKDSIEDNTISPGEEKNVKFALIKRNSLR